MAIYHEQNLKNHVSKFLTWEEQLMFFHDWAKCLWIYTQDLNSFSKWTLDGQGKLTSNTRNQI